MTVWEILLGEARGKQECMVCGFPLHRTAKKLRVKCDRPDCLRAYHAMYARLKRRRDVLAT